MMAMMRTLKKSGHMLLTRIFLRKVSLPGPLTERFPSNIIHDSRTTSTSFLSDGSNVAGIVPSSVCPVSPMSVRQVWPARSSCTHVHVRACVHKHTHTLWAAEAGSAESGDCIVLFRGWGSLWRFLDPSGPRLTPCQRRGARLPRMQWNPAEPGASVEKMNRNAIC